jgi:hypothetical protein
MNHSILAGASCWEDSSDLSGRQFMTTTSPPAQSEWSSASKKRFVERLACPVHRDEPIALNHASILKYMRANNWSCKGLSGTHMLARQGGGVKGRIPLGKGMCDRIRVLRVIHADTHALCVHPVATGVPGRTRGEASRRGSMLKRQHQQTDDSKGPLTGAAWTAEEDASILEYMRANNWSCKGFSGTHMLARQGGGVKGRIPLGKRNVRQDMCAESDTC